MLLSDRYAAEGVKITRLPPQSSPPLPVPVEPRLITGKYRDPNTGVRLRFLSKENPYRDHSMAHILLETLRVHGLAAYYERGGRSATLSAFERAGLIEQIKTRPIGSIPIGVTGLNERRRDSIVFEIRDDDLHDFAERSNAIAGVGDVQFHQFAAVRGFLLNATPSVGNLEELAKHFDQSARLRASPGMNVELNGRNVPPGGSRLVRRVRSVLDSARECEVPWWTYCMMVHLHPFTIGNGRVARAVWAWQMVRIHNGQIPPFLAAFHAQSIAGFERLLQVAVEAETSD